MILLQKLEFWILSVPSLVVAVGAIVHYGAWRVLWLFAGSYVLSTTLHLGKGLVTELVDSPRTWACRKGKWAKAFVLLMLIPAYNWFVATALADIVYLLVAWRYRGAMPLPFVYTIVFAVSFSFPALTRQIQRRSDGGYGDVIVEAERILLLGAILVSAFVDLSPGLFALASVAFGIIAVGILGAMWYKGQHRIFNEYWEAEKKGVPFDMRGKRKWFPRPGVVFEPDESASGPVASRLGQAQWDKFRPAITVLSVSTVAFISLALFIGGAAVLIDRWHGLLLFAAFGSLVLWILHSAFIEHEKWDTWVVTFANAAPYAFCYFLLSSLVVWLGKGDLVTLISLGAFLVACFEFPTRHVLRASSDLRPDALRFICTVCAVGFAVYMRHWNAAPWWACALCATAPAYPLVVLRHFWPLKPLSPPNGANTAAAGAVSGDSAKKARRDRKRERQIAALRRSQRRDV